MSLRLLLLAGSFALAFAAASSKARAQHASLEDRSSTNARVLGVAFDHRGAHPSYSKCVARVWIPGRYEVSCERVWVAGCSRQVWTPARYEWRWDSCGRVSRVCLSMGGWSTVTEPGHYELRESRVWVPGHWRFA